MLGRHLLQVQRDHPSKSRSPSSDFHRLWTESIDLPYLASDEQLPGLLILNREAAALCRGPEGEPYRQGALQNLGRIRARLGENLPTEAQQLLPQDERIWLEWVRDNTRGRAPSTKAWKPQLSGWRLVKKLSKELQDSPRRGLGKEAQAALKRSWKEEDRAQPQGHLLRLLIEVEVHRLLDKRKWKPALRLAAKSPDGEVNDLVLEGFIRRGSLRRAERPEVTTRLRYRCYRLKRHRLRLEALGLQGAAARCEARLESLKSLERLL